MENAYYLVVEQQAAGQCPRTLGALPLAVAAGLHIERASRPEWRQRQAALDAGRYARHMRTRS